jgi:type VI secretion system protein VasJ
VEHLEGLDAACTEHLGDEAPLLLPISRRLKNMVQRAADNRPEPGVVSVAMAQVKQAATQLFTPGAPIDNEKEAHKALRVQQENARPLCAWWLKQTATDLRALRLNRTLLWLPIDTLPERNAEQITVLRGLPADKLKTFQDRYDQAKYADVLVDLEASLAKAPFWFDGQRMVWECLHGLNAEMAMREAEIHFALLIQRLPGIIELHFHDGAPFANPATRVWIGAHVMPHLQSTSAPRKADVVDTQPAWELALEDVQPILRQDGLKAAVQVLKQGLHSAHGARARFFWQFALARLCFMARKFELAKIQLEILDQTLREAGLHTWEPDLALQVLQLLHSCCESLPQSHAVRECKEEIYRRLCHLDLEVALD